MFQGLHLQSWIKANFHSWNYYFVDEKSNLLWRSWKLLHPRQCSVTLAMYLRNWFKNGPRTTDHDVRHNLFRNVGEFWRCVKAQSVCSRLPQGMIAQQPYVHIQWCVRCFLTTIVPSRNTPCGKRPLWATASSLPFLEKSLFSQGTSVSITCTVPHWKASTGIVVRWTICIISVSRFCSYQRPSQ